VVDFARLSAEWHRWARGIGGGAAAVSTECDDCEALFSTDDYSVHLRTENRWWIIDVVDDRGQRRSNVAEFSTFELAEKYLTWDWVTMANSSLASGRLGAELYRQGYAADVNVTELNSGKVEVCFHDECAILVVGTAAIFSHIMKMSLDEIQEIARLGN
jgi:hypothetical protein